MLHNFDTVCVGNAKIDAFLSIHEANDCLRLNKDLNELCVKYGEKIQVDRCEFLLGGNAANVSVGLSRLGLKSSLCAEIGDDELSQKILNTLKKENIDTRCLIQTRGGKSSFSIIINFKGERTIFSQHVERLHNFTFEDISTRSIYLTSLGHEWKKPYKKVSEFVKKTQCFLAFNPGTLQIKTGEKGIGNILSITDILFVNKEEAARISNVHPPSGGLISNEKRGNIDVIQQLLKSLKNLGPKVVIITDGKNGSYAMDEKGKMLRQDRISCKIVENTGAGDAYSTGFLAAFLHGLTLKDAMRWGAVNASNVLGKVGAQTGLLRKEEMQEKLRIISNY